MQISPDNLRYLREQRGLTRDELAAELGCSASAIVQWEGSKRAIPEWVAEKMWRKIPIEYTTEELSELLELARSEGLNFMQLMTQAAKHIVQSRRAGRYYNTRKTSFTPLSTDALIDSPACAPTATSPAPSPMPASPSATANIVKLPPPPALASMHPRPLERVAEPPPGSSAEPLPPRKEISYGKPKRKRG